MHILKKIAGRFQMTPQPDGAMQNYSYYNQATVA